MQKYVSYDPQTGELVAANILDVAPEYGIAVSDEVYADWLSYRANAARDGVELLPPAPPPKPPVPPFVAMWQARAIMIEDDILDDVNAYLAAIPDEKERRVAQAKFEYSNTVRRDDPLAKFVIPQLGKSEAEIDAMFIRAAAL